ncbi:CinA family nicotinamide mononucleotide deamidase-related protein [Staphylococcus auricularis]|uniref:Putative competence-damage inducible protein n=1 Tax=Staphylococcus auricularis TaxID=29379 RepID=A0AAP8TU62_9STAP|nr:CinA family nicotinamide mononucleotide deamidase-related protein [Staphylococcus auricularis]PNZ69567.1 competence/damage-inducible protein A [Staphylococcus auricularis]QPT05440.1 CinA family nicotinamide mononucleotide deamidase-related protein [Staphylococcus auricularis]BCU52177.1 CinA family nicotinamide mononucleotide deamidase-related protein [Staphylococcus auricularis]SQJ10868.1 competence-damage inducible protein cinA [Staphylococcus auricularis]
MQAEIIAVGSELLLGQIANTNGQYLSRLLNTVGHSVLAHSVVGDNPERLERVVRNAIDHNDLIVLTGGLGPTKDDLTKQTVARVLNKSLVTDDQALQFIEQSFAESKQQMTENNKQQALVIEGAKVLENKVGMAPGMLLDYEDKKIILLPGSPKEMEPMAKNELLPLLFDGEQSIFSESLHFAGIGESILETEIDDLIDAQTNPTIAPLAGHHEVEVRLTANGNTKAECQKLIEPIKQQILERIGDYYYGSDDIVLEQAVMQQLDQSMVLYDGVTDGALYSRLQDYNTSGKLEGVLLHTPQFVKGAKDTEDALAISTRLAKSFYDTELIVSILNEGNTVYLGILDDNDLTVETFHLTNQRNILKNRSQNYVLIRLLKWLKGEQ